MITRLQRIVAWLRTGYPHGIPERHYLPLVALLGRRLSDDETRELGERLVAGGLVPADRLDVAVGYLRITDQLPSNKEIARVCRLLREAGWPVRDDGPDSR